MNIPENTLADAIEAAQLRGQPARLVRFLGENGPALTGQVAREVRCNNISDAAARANRRLRPHGYEVVATLPPRLVANDFGEKTRSHIWQIRREA